MIKYRLDFARKYLDIDKSLAEAAAKFVDEDFTFEITIPKDLSIDEVLETCHQECIKVEDEYDLFILPKVVYEQ